MLWKVLAVWFSIGAALACLMALVKKERPMKFFNEGDPVILFGKKYIFVSMTTPADSTVAEIILTNEEGEQRNFPLAFIDHLELIPS